MPGTVLYRSMVSCGWNHVQARAIMAMIRKRVIRVGGWAVAAVCALALLAAAVGAAWFYRAAISSLPLLEGSLQISGLSASVEIARDDHGVPHLSAENLEDLVFAQGFVTAQDRLWQMDMNRRYGRGELAEILGSGMVPSDRRHRILQVSRAAEAAVAALNPADRRFLDAYTRGVNALMNMQRNRWPVEFRVLGYEPRPWTPEDSVVVGINITESLTTQFETEHARERLTAALGPHLSADLYLSCSWRDRWPGSPPHAQPRADEIVQPLEALLGLRPDFVRWRGRAAAPAEADHPGSNNWVLAGGRTATGKPLLSNDMHLAHSIPNVWYMVHLRGGGLDVAGVSFPGLPFVVAGRNRRIAWGYTNLGADVQDLFIEQFNASGEYKAPEGWRQPERRPEVIRVRRGEDVELEVTLTRHGPVVSELLPAEERRLALQWTVYDPATLGMNLLGLNLAGNWEQFLAALSRFAGA
ncbi:MAG: penicillin acylase family protein, partial [Acidobacteria bacterium]|nr:penicillin acylase family protein [Acidobacteriota bacterium]